MKSEMLPGLHIQWPWSRLLLSGEKTIETRSYPLPAKFIGKEMAIIETAGKDGSKQADIQRAQIIGTIVFSGCSKYQSKAEWTADFSSHRVKDGDPTFGFDDLKEKWGWKVRSVRALERPVPPPSSRGIVYARDCEIPL